MLSKKHYKAIAEILELNCRDKEDKVVLVERFSDYFKKDNPLFNESKFYQACNTYNK